MPNFGFSAYLKLVCLNDKPQLTEIKKRITPSEGGYDYHRSLKRLSKEMLLEGRSLDSVLEAAEAIGKENERNSAKHGLQVLSKWVRAHPLPRFSAQAVTYESPNRVFGVRFEPSFGAVLDGRNTAVHIWNTKKPPLQRRFVLGALATVAPLYRSLGSEVTDVAVLSLREMVLYKLSDATDQRAALAFGTAVAGAMERLFERGSRELGISIGPRPSAPPAPPLP